MSRLGKKEIAFPMGVTANFVLGKLTVKGPKGELTRTMLPEINIEITPTGIGLTPRSTSVFTRSLWGTYSSHVINMMEGVTAGFSKKLLIEGTGYKWEVAGNKLKLALGLSHPVEMPIPEGLTVKAEKGELTISGIDKEVVGSFAAAVRSKKKPEPYKGKGIRYSTEVIERKQGKRSAT